MISFNLHKYENEAVSTYRLADFVFVYARIPKPRRRDFEGKSSLDEREAYKGTLSEETAIAKGNTIKMKKTVGFQPRFLLNNTKVTKEAPCKQDAPFSFCDYTKIPKPRRRDSEQKFSLAPRSRTYVRREEANGNRKQNTDKTKKIRPTEDFQP